MSPGGDAQPDPSRSRVHGKGYIDSLSRERACTRRIIYTISNIPPEAGVPWSDILYFLIFTLFTSIATVIGRYERQCIGCTDIYLILPRGANGVKCRDTVTDRVSADLSPSRHSLGLIGPNILAEAVTSRHCVSDVTGEAISWC